MQHINLVWVYRDVFTLSSPMQNCRAYEPIIKQVYYHIYLGIPWQAFVEQINISL